MCSPAFLLLALVSFALATVECLHVNHRYSAYHPTTMANANRPDYETYLQERQVLIDDHRHRALGADVPLTEKEQQLNAILMDYKNEELTRGFLNPFNFTPSRHFFEVLKTVETSPLFQLIRQMPKGLPTLQLLHSTSFQMKSYPLSF